MTNAIGRLALRIEGQYWNAYYAEPGTMVGAVFLGSIAMRFVTDNVERKNAFMAMMREAVADLLEERLGTRPVMEEPRSAPESERSGSA